MLERLLLSFEKLIVPVTNLLTEASHKSILFVFTQVAKETDPEIL